MEKNELAKYIDHTVLKPDATGEMVKTLCSEAIEYGFAAVCINPCHVDLAVAQLGGTDVKVCTVIGFPLGANFASVKGFEARQAVEAGAMEVDMVINVGALKSGDEALVSEDIRAVVSGVAEANSEAIVKVIIETCLLTDDEKMTACRLAMEAGAHYVKTSTGFSTGGATVADVALMRSVVGDKLGVKASGGIHNRNEALAMIDAGASRIGASAGIKIVSGE